MKAWKSNILVLAVLAIGVVGLAGCGGGGGGGGSSTPAENENSLPQLDAVGAQYAVEGDQFSVAFSASDPDNDPMTFGLSGMPENGWDLAENGVLTWTPSAGLGGDFYKVYSVTVSVSDGEDSVSETFDITVFCAPDLATEDTNNTVGVTAFHQNIPAEDGDPEVFPGQANVWDLDRDFSLFDGGDGQFEGALEMKVGGTDFPKDLTYSELTFYTPYVKDEDGVVVALADSSGSLGSGSYSAWFNGTSLSRLEQQVDLTGYTTSSDIALSWYHDIDLAWETMYSSESDNFYYEVKLRLEDGTSVPLFSRTGLVVSDGTETFDLSDYAGQSVTLVFEIHYAKGDASNAYALVDDVSVLADGTDELITNGDFETGDLQGWQTNALQEVQNVASASRSLEGLDVNRQFYTVPNNLWGRWVDVFTNSGSTDIVKTVQYRTTLGSSGYGVIYDTTGSGLALTSWDGADADGVKGTRDIGWVVGSADDVLYTSSPSLGANTGDPEMDVFYDITVPAGESVSIVQFVLMNGKDTGQSASSVDADAVQIDGEIDSILADFWYNPNYRDGMTQKQIDTVINLPQQ